MIHLVHGPIYVYCPDPELCCGRFDVIAIVCRVDRQDWPCETKRSHHTPAYGARVDRWVRRRLGELERPR